MISNNSKIYCCAIRFIVILRLHSGLKFEEIIYGRLRGELAKEKKD